MEKIICVGKNYEAHAVEMGDGPVDRPIIFLKPPSCLTVVKSNDACITLPKSSVIHHELELVLRLQEGGQGWSFSHFTLGLDLTLRDEQKELKARGQPWERAKVFPHSAIIGAWVTIDSLDSLMGTEFYLKVNDEIRQKGHGREMKFSPQVILADIQKWLLPKDGDLLFTGTPSGVGPLKTGDKVEVSGPAQYRFTCA